MPSHSRFTVPRSVALAALALAFAPACATDADGPLPSADSGSTPAGAVTSSWSRFRGPNGSGVVADADAPVEFSPRENVQWAVSLPEGKSSPIVVDNRVVVTGVEGNRFVTVALDADTGEIDWRREVERPRDDGLYRENDSATPTPASDGRAIYVFFLELGLLKYDLQGNEMWRMDLGPFDNFYGLSASPIAVGDTVMLLCDQVSGSFLLAIDSNSGEPRWRAERPGRIESWTTPVLYPEDAPETVLVFGSGWIDAYSLSSGEHQWELPGVGEGPIASPVLAGSTLVVSAINHAEQNLPTFDNLLATVDADANGRLTEAEFSGVPGFGEHFGWTDRNGDGELVAAEYDGLMELTENPNYGAVAVALPAPGSSDAPEILWSHKQSLPYVPTPLILDGIVYLVRDGGIVTSLDLGTGDVLKRGRTSRSSGSVYASPVAAGDQIFIASMEGEVAVLRAGSDWEVIAVNELDEPLYASPTIAGGRLLVRTPTTLYSFAGEH